MFSLAILLAAAAPVSAPPRSFIPPVSPKAVVSTPSGLRFETLKAGTGAMPTDADMVLVTYEGHLADGTLFDASAQPTAFPVTGVVPGFAEALKRMQKGGRYRLWIPSALAYGAEGAGGGAIPPNAELEFIVNLIDMKPTAEVQAAAPPPPAPPPPQPQP